MNPWQRMAEAKIRDWQLRKERGELRSVPDAALESLEGQLYNEVIRAREAAATATDPRERQAHRDRAEAARIRLMVILERGDRPLLREAFEKLLEEV
jgi:hypothetical protein